MEANPRYPEAPPSRGLLLSWMAGVCFMATSYIKGEALMVGHELSAKEFHKISGKRIRSKDWEVFRQFGGG